jgi:hypothetical protein
MLLTPMLIFVVEYILTCFGYQVSPDPLPLVQNKNRGVTDYGLELEPTTATMNPLPLAATTSAQQEAQVEQEQGGLDDIPEQDQDENECDDSVQTSAINISTSSSFNSASTFQRDVTIVRPRLRNDSIGGANAATLHALDAARMSRMSRSSSSIVNKSTSL